MDNREILQDNLVSKLSNSIDILLSTNVALSIELKYEIEASELFGYIDRQIANGRLHIDYSDDHDIWFLFAEEIVLERSKGCFLSS
jgi:hypothetical protein